MSAFSKMTDAELIAAHWRHRHAKAIFAKGGAIPLVLLEQSKINAVEAEASRRRLVLCGRSHA